MPDLTQWQQATGVAILSREPMAKFYKMHCQNYGIVTTVCMKWTIKYCVVSGISAEQLIEGGIEGV